MRGWGWRGACVKAVSVAVNNIMLKPPQSDKSPFGTGNIVKVRPGAVYIHNIYIYIYIYIYTHNIYIYIYIILYYICISLKKEEEDDAIETICTFVKNTICLYSSKHATVT